MYVCMHTSSSWQLQCIKMILHVLTGSFNGVFCFLLHLPSPLPSPPYLCFPPRPPPPTLQPVQEWLWSCACSSLLCPESAVSVTVGEGKQPTARECMHAQHVSHHAAQGMHVIDYMVPHVYSTLHVCAIAHSTSVLLSSSVASICAWRLTVTRMYVCTYVFSLCHCMKVYLSCTGTPQQWGRGWRAHKLLSKHFSVGGVINSSEMASQIVLVASGCNVTPPPPGQEKPSRVAKGNSPQTQSFRHFRNIGIVYIIACGIPRRFL